MLMMTERKRKSKRKEGKEDKKGVGDEINKRKRKLERRNRRKKS